MLYAIYEGEHKTFDEFLRISITWSLRKISIWRIGHWLPSNISLKILNTTFVPYFINSVTIVTQTV